MAASTQHILPLLDKLTSRDKDLRVMGAIDLQSELANDRFRMDERLERKVVTAVLKLLGDKVAIVQNEALKCLDVLAPKVTLGLLEEIVARLIVNALESEEEQLRDLSFIGLKSVVAIITPETVHANVICSVIVGRLLQALQDPTSPTVLDLLDLLSTLLQRFPFSLVPEHSRLQATLLPFLQHGRSVVRKRAVTVFGYLIRTMDDASFNGLVGIIGSSLEGASNEAQGLTMVSTLHAFAREGGPRIGPHLANAVPLVLGSVEKYEEADDYTEACIKAVEAFAFASPAEFAPFVDDVVSNAVRFLAYDPNYNYESDSEGESSGAESGSELESEEESEEEQYSDDEDLSWKVRRAAARLLLVIVQTRPDLLDQFLSGVAGELVARFKEREENVRLDVFATFVGMLEQTMNLVPLAADPRADGSPRAVLAQLVPRVVANLRKQIVAKSSNVRQGVVTVFRTLVAVLPGGLADHLAQLAPGFKALLTDGKAASKVKISCLHLVVDILDTHSLAGLADQVPDLASSVVTATNDPFYKIAAEGLRTASKLVQAMRPDVDAPFPEVYRSALEAGCVLAHTCLAQELFASAVARLKANDIDQEVKEQGIKCTASILASAADVLSSSVATVLPLFLSRLENEITRLAAIDGITVIASSRLGVNLSDIFSETLQLLASFLRKSSRPLRLAAAQALNVLLGNNVDVEAALVAQLEDNAMDGPAHPPKRRCTSVPIDAGITDQLMAALPPLIVDDDLFAAQLSLSLATKLLADHPEVAPRCLQEPSIVEAVCDLSVSPLLQGETLQACLGFHQAIATAGCPGLTPGNLVAKLLSRAGSVLAATTAASVVPRQALATLAKSIAVVAVRDAATLEEATAQFLGEIAGGAASDVQALFALLCVGEIGKMANMQCHDGLLDLISGCFEAPSEDVKTAAAFALGSVAVGNLGCYLPLVLQELASKPKRQYLLLHALKIVIGDSVGEANRTTLGTFVDEIWGLLFANCESPEEGTRNVVAECLGRLTLLSPADLIPRLQASLGEGSANARATVITAVKHVVTDNSSSVNDILQSTLPQFFRAIADEDVGVRRVALVAFNSAAHNKPGLAIHLLDDVLPLVYQETVPRPELVREVEMGPFKHKVDDGLDARKAAFECMYTLLDVCPGRLSIQDFITRVLAGLRDHYDIQLLTYLMVARLAGKYPSDVLQRVDDILDGLMAAIDIKLKANAVKQEVEKIDELKKSAVRAVHTIHQLPGADKAVRMPVVLKKIEAVPLLRKRFEALSSSDSTGATTTYGGSEAMDTS